MAQQSKNLLELWKLWEIELAPKEEALNAAMHPDVAKVLAGKPPAVVPAYSVLAPLS